MMCGILFSKKTFNNNFDILNLFGGSLGVGVSPIFPPFKPCDFNFATLFQIQKTSKPNSKTR